MRRQFEHLLYVIQKWNFKMKPIVKLLFPSIFVLQITRLLCAQTGLNTGALISEHPVVGVQIGGSNDGGSAHIESGGAERLISDSRENEHIYGHPHNGGGGGVIGNVVNEVKGATGGILNDAGNVIGSIRKGTKGLFDTARNDATHVIGGFTKSICRVSFAAENLIGDVKELHIRVDRKIDEIDQAVVNYITDKIIKRAVDVVRRNHIGFVTFLVDVHISLDRFIYNSIIEAYRITKAPVRELFHCH